MEERTAPRRNFVGWCFWKVATTFTVMALSVLFSFVAKDVVAADWSDTEMQVLYSNQFQEPFNPNDVSKLILTFQHASGYKYGRNFFFVDILKSDGKDGKASEVYGEWYSTFSLSKMTGKEMKFSIIKDVGLTIGLNYGAKSTGAGPEVYLPGVTVDLNMPGFTFLNVNIMAYIDRGKFNGVSNGCSTGFNITPTWKIPFTISSAKFTFEGFIDYVSDHGGCKAQILTQPQIRLDVGNFIDNADKVYVGVEYQLWQNKFGIKDLNDNFPQLLGVWKF